MGLAIQTHNFKEYKMDTAKAIWCTSVIWNFVFFFNYAIRMYFKYKKLRQDGKSFISELSPPDFVPFVGIATAASSYTGLGSGYELVANVVFWWTLCTLFLVGIPIVISLSRGLPKKFGEVGVLMAPTLVLSALLTFHGSEEKVTLDRQLSQRNQSTLIILLAIISVLGILVVYLWYFRRIVVDFIWSPWESKSASVYMAFPSVACAAATIQMAEYLSWMELKWMGYVLTGLSSCVTVSVYILFLGHALSCMLW